LAKKKSLAGFDEVAKDNDNTNDNVNIEDILGDQTPTKQLVGIYFEPDLAAALDRLSAGKRGAKSKLVNVAVREMLQSRGLL